MSKRKKPTAKQMQRLWDACVKHVDQHKILCAESCYQMDGVVLAAPELTETVAKIVGYFPCEEDDA